MNTSLSLLRQINPPPRLLEQLESINHAFQFEDGTVWVDDALPRDAALNQSITGWGDEKGQWQAGCTVGWGIFDGDLNKLAFYKDLVKALTAMARAKPVIVTEFELDQEDAPTEVTPGGAQVTTELGKKKPFEA